MNAWVSVVSHPFGLAGFALWLLVTWAARRNRARQPGWLTAGLYAFACVALIGGIYLARVQVRKTGSSPTTVNQQHIDQINQQSSGSGAVNAAGVQGSVTTNNGPTREDSVKTKKKAAK